MKRLASFLTTIVASIALTYPQSLASDAAQCNIVTTTTIIADTTSALLGDVCGVTSLMQAGVDPHLYSPSPRDLRSLMRADIIIHNGLHLEGKMSELLQKLSSKKPVISAASSLPSQLLITSQQGQGIIDPHIWLNVSLWERASNSIYSDIVTLLPQHKESITKRFLQWSKELQELHKWALLQIRSIPKHQRILVTAHDAFGYFGRAYDIEVLAIQGISTESEASLHGINTLIKTIVSKKVPAVFIENTISPKSIHALIAGAAAQGHQVQLGGQLLGDALGEPGTPGDTYQSMIKRNVATIVAGLGRKL